MKSVMIGGFIVSGQSSKFVVRAIGPSLAAFGITGTLSDPTLAVKNADGVTGSRGSPLKFKNWVWPRLILASPLFS